MECSAHYAELEQASGKSASFEEQRNEHLEGSAEDICSVGLASSAGMLKCSSFGKKHRKAAHILVVERLHLSPFLLFTGPLLTFYDTSMFKDANIETYVGYVSVQLFKAEGLFKDEAFQA